MTSKRKFKFESDVTGNNFSENRGANSGNYNRENANSQNYQSESIAKFSMETQINQQKEKEKTKEKEKEKEREEKVAPESKENNNNNDTQLLNTFEFYKEEV